MPEQNFQTIRLSGGRHAVAISRRGPEARSETLALLDEVLELGRSRDEWLIPDVPPGGEVPAPAAREQAPS